MKQLIPLTALKKRRIALGTLSQGDVARQLGVVTSLYGGIERGQIHCNSERATLISKILKTSKTSLFKLDDKEKNIYRAITIS